MNRVVLVLVGCLMNCLYGAQANSQELRGADRKGTVLCVSKLGDNSDGSSWAKAFTTVQRALDAVPDDKGGHRIVIRPDIYMEANLFPSRKGAPGAYNIIESDFDGSMGSGTTGYAVIDCSDPERGLKSVDWWGPFRADPTFSGVVWDRWIVRHLYVTGGDGGLFWDLPPKVEPFTIIVEDSVGIGRAFGGGVAHIISRPQEPIMFRRCHLWSLDWWGDAAGAYVRAETSAMPDHPDVTFEDCTLVGPDSALKAGNPGYSGYSRVKLKGCRLISLNFSQPRGTPSRGIIYSVIDGKLLHVDLEDCLLMGYKVFGAGKAEVSYSTKGCVQAYVQFEQPVPAGFLRLGHWPAEIFRAIVPPEPPESRRFLKTEGVVRHNLCEVAAVVWHGKLCLVECIRPASGGSLNEHYLVLRDVDTGEELARFAEGYSLASALVRNNTMYVFASRCEPKGGTWNDVTLFKSSDLKHWHTKVVIQQDAPEHLFNSSVCQDDNGFVMAYETDDPKYPAFTIKFARSNDLENWKKVPDAIFGTDRYTACPCIRYVNGYYYMMYLEHRTPRWFFETFLARSKDLKTWQLSRANPVLSPDSIDDGINASDPEVIEFGGHTYAYYSVGDQRTWMNLKRAVYPGPVRGFFEQWFAGREVEQK